MSTQKQFTAENLTEGTILMVRGKIAYSRLTKLIDGADLVAVNQRKAANNMSPINSPHVTCALTQPQVVFTDPSNPSYDEQFVAERFYVSPKNPSAGPMYSIDSKGKSLPTIAVPSDKGDDSYDQDTSGRELANGLDVTLVLRVYKPKNYAKRGMAIEHIVVNEPVRYYSGSNAATEALAARGIVFNAPPVAVAPSNEPAPVHPDDEGNEPVVVPQGSRVQDGLVMPAPPAATPVAPAPAPAPAAAAPTVAPVAAPAASVQEDLQAELTRLKAENNALKDSGSAFGAPAQADQTQSADVSGDNQDNPWVPQTAGGITYQP